MLYNALRFAAIGVFGLICQFVLSQTVHAIAVTGFVPTSGAVGASIRIDGNGFASDATVTFGGIAARSVTYVSATRLFATVSVDAVTGPIRVRSGGVLGTSLSSFTVTIPPPAITSLSTTSGVVGNTVVIHGNNFGATPNANSVRFNGVAAIVSSATTQALVVFVPPYATTGPIVVTFGGQSATSATFTVTCPTAETVSTLAGLSGSVGSTNGSGSAARFQYPEGIATDSLGNVFVADSNNHTIRKVTAAGLATTFAGLANTIGSADGTGSNARFNYPLGITIDVANNLYVTDSGNNTIRKITSAGVVTTLAGSPGVSGTADGTGSAARFTSLSGLAVDSAGNLYVGAYATIRKITAAGAVTTFAGLAGTVGSTDGTGSAARFNSLGNIAIDTGGNLYVADALNFTIRKITPAAVVTTFAGTTGSIGSADGTGNLARFNAPIGMAMDGAGNLYVADSGNHTIRKITSAGVVTTLAGVAGTAGSADGVGAAATFNRPWGVAVDAVGTLYVADTNNHTIRKILATPDCPKPICTSMGPKNAVIPNSATTATFYAYGVQNATVVYFPTWWVDGGNQNDIQWLLGTPDGNGTWHTDVPLSQYDTGNPRYGNFATHVYLANPNYQNGTNQYCDGTGWVRQAPPPPNAPKDVTVPATNTSGTFTVSWTPSASGTTATYFQLQRATSATGPWTTLNANIPASTTTYSNTVPASGTYYYQVAACSAGCSPYTVSSSVVVTLAPAPTCTSIGVVANPVPYGTNTQRVYAYGVQNATTVYFPTWWIPGNQADLQNPWLTGTNQGGGTWYVDIDLTQYDPGMPRYGAFETDVYMSNPSYRNGTTVPCAGTSWTRTAPPLPSAPTSVSGTGAGLSVNVAWVPNNNAGPTDYYELQRSTSSGGPWNQINLHIAPSTQTNYSDNSISAAGTYFYEVASCNGGGCSGFTVSAGIVVTAPPQSDPPSVSSAPPRDGTSDSVGATLAQFRVDEGGNSTYSIPIQVPPGTAGVAPKVALSYNSRLPSGVMGPGWTIEGASQIARCRQTRENGDFMSGTTPIDGNPAPVNFTTTDRFCLDGVRLLLLNGSYGANSSTYSPENDPTTKVTASTSNANAGPATFTVQRKDGTSSTYGATTTSPNAGPTASVNSQSVNVMWNLARVQDSVSNYMDYLYYNKPANGTYAFAAGAIESTLARVNYTGHVTPQSNTYASVAFNYTTLPVASVRLGYQAGVAFVQSQQLQNVTVSDSTQSSPTLRYYSLTYDNTPGATPQPSSGSGAIRLLQIKECRDTSMVVCYPATVFTWSTANYAVASEGTQSGPSFTNLVSYKVADVDGDGRLDFVFAVDGDSHCSGVSAIYVGFMDLIMDLNTSNNHMTLSMGSQTPTCAPIDLNGNDQAWYLIDYDGDGLADLMMGGKNGAAWVVDQSRGRPSSGNVFTTNLLAGLSPSINAPSAGTAVGILADFNGDGLPDFVYPAPANADNLLARIMVRNPSSGQFQFSSDVYTLSLTSTDYWEACGGAATCNVGLFANDGRRRSVITSDFNGDGRADLTLAVTGADSTSKPTGTSSAVPPPQYGAAPSDSPLPSALTRTTYWYQFATQAIDPIAHTITVARYWQGQAWTASATTAPLPGGASKFFAVDVNGDGLADILYQTPNPATGVGTETYAVMLNMGTGYSSPITVTGIHTNSTDTSPTIQLADINGDGRLDILYPSLATGASTYNYVTLLPDSSASSGWSFSGEQSAPAGLQANAGWIALIADFDGDGASDFLRIDRPSSTYYTARTTSGNRYNARDVVNGFTNGLGAKTTVVYQPLTNHGVYQWGVGTPRTRALNSTNWGYGSPVFDLLAPMYVVSQASSSAPVKGAAAAASTVYYRYQGALMQSGGRGFLGFWAIWAFDNNDTAIESGKYMVTLNGYGQQYPFIGFPETTFKMAFSGALTRGIGGDTTLDACATSGPEANTSCFAPGLPNSATSDPTAWPDITNNGVVVGYSATRPWCNGTGCTAVEKRFTDLCTGVSTSLSQPNTPQITDGEFVPQATAGPLFTYALWSDDAQYDLGDGVGFGGAVTPTAHVQGTFCYDTNSPPRGNLVNSSVITSEGVASIVGQKYTANTYGSDNTGTWFLGRLTNSVVTFTRGTDTKSRSTDYTYDPTTGLLTSERIQKNGAADQDLRTLYVIDSYGNRTAAYQCSKDLTDAQCKSTTGFVEQQSGTQVHRYAKTTYNTDLADPGRYSTGSALPFSDSNGQWNQQTAVSIGARDEFGNSVSQSSIDGLAQAAEFGALGRPFFTADNTGKASTTTFRTCGSGTGQVGCSNDPMIRFRSQTITVGAPATWTYFDLLGRPVLKIAQNFNIENNTAGQLFSATCGYFDSHNRPTYQSEPFFVNVTAAADGSPNISTATASPCASANYSTTSTYDVLGRVASITNPDGGIVNKSYIGLTTFTSSPRNSTWEWEETKNGLGEIIETRDPDPSDASANLIVNTYYDAAGNVTKVTRNAGNGLITTLMNYDVLGRKSNQTDPDAGYISYTYNAAGDAITQTDAKNQTVTQSYDAMGRRWKRAVSNAADNNNFADTWTYDTAANGYGQVASETRPAFGTQQPFSRSYVYDGYGRLYQRVTNINVTSTYTETTAYDSVGRLKGQQDASGYLLNPHYTTHGFVDYQSDSRTGTHIYQMNSVNERGQVVSDQRGGTTALASVHSYKPETGRLYQLCSGSGANISGNNCTGGNLQNLAYAFDLAGNLSARSHPVSGQTLVEVFSYDALNRLKQAGVPQTGTVNSPPSITAALSITYDKLGNICTKTTSDLGTQTYTYAGLAGCLNNNGTSGLSPHAVTKVNGVTYSYDTDGNQTNTSGGRALTFDALNQMTQASNASDNAKFQYSEGGDRFQRVDQNGTRTTYLGNVEIVAIGTSTEFRRYLAGVAIDYVRSSGSNETRYTFGDHLGSADVIAKSDGTLFESTSFDAHGSRRSASTWSGAGTALQSTTHGFTGQEQLDSLGLVHMNGRVYDPQLGRMLQADPLTGPGPQGLNRYSYVANNPLTLTDPMGYSWWGNILKAAAGVAIAIFAPELLAPYLGTFGSVVAAGFIAGVVTTGTLQGGLIGAFTAGVFFGIGQAFDSGGFLHNFATDGVSGGEGVAGTAYNIEGFGAKVLAHGIAGGVMSSLEGGKFGNGFLSAGVAEAASGQIDKLDPENPIGKSVSAQRVVAASIVGGTTSALTGGKFANGAITAAFGRAFNEESKIMELDKQDSASVSRAAHGLRTLIRGYSVEEFAQAYPGTEGNAPDLADAVLFTRGQFEEELGAMEATSLSRVLVMQIGESIGEFPRDAIVGFMTGGLGEAGATLETVYDAFSIADKVNSAVSGRALVFCTAEGNIGCGFVITKH